MNTIHLQHTLPEVFAKRNDITSDIWMQDVTFERGQSYLIEATSGTGKSSLCSYIIGYRQDYQGIIKFDEQNVRNFGVKEWTEQRRCHLSHLFQELRLFPELTAMENVQIKNTLTGFKKKKEIKLWFEQLGIADKMNVPVRLLSYGQQQRVALMRALCQPMDFLFADEPISHLDEVNSSIMAQLITEEAEKQGAGIVVTSIGKRLPLNYNKVFCL